jgi:hypothetical protein
MELNDLIHAQHRAELGLMKTMLDAEDFTTEFIEASDELPVAALVIDLGQDDLERQRLMTVSVMPFGDDQFAQTNFIQFYVPMPFKASPGTMGDLGHAIAVVNGAMAVGHFGVRGSEVFFRYMLSYDSGTTIGSGMLLELMSMLMFHQEHFADYLEGVLDGEISLAVLPKLIAQTDP